MAIEETVLAALKTQLTNDATLAAYVKNIFLGVRDGIPNFPCLVIEPSELQESDDIYGRQELRLKILIVGFLEVLDPDQQICAIAPAKGILNFLLDVKKAISADRTVGGNVIQTYIQNAKFEYVEYPLRSFNLSAELFFRQGTTSRT